MKTQTPNVPEMDEMDTIRFSQRFSALTPVQRADTLVELSRKSGRGRRAPGYKDDKVYVSHPETMRSLVFAGAHVWKANDLHPDNRYLTEVTYREHRFVHSSSEPLDLSKS